MKKHCSINFQKDDALFHAQLRPLLHLLFTRASSSQMSAYFQIISSYTLCALAHRVLKVRTFALDVLTMLMQHYRNLCLKDEALFDSFLVFLDSEKKTSDRKVSHHVCRS